MGEKLSQYRVGFNKSVRLESRSERITSEAGAFLTRDVLERLGILRFLHERLKDTRNSKLITGLYPTACGQGRAAHMPGGLRAPGRWVSRRRPCGEFGKASDALCRLPQKQRET